MSSYNSWEEVFPDSTSLALPELQKRFISAVYDHVVLELIQFNKNNTKPTLPTLSQNTLLAKLYFNASPTSLSQTEMQSLWMLLRQDEYFLMQLLKDFKHMPKIYGTCGKFYALEKVQMLIDFVGVGLFSAAVTWRVRVRLALELMDFIQELDSKKSYGFTWQHCDIQASNFGVNNAGRIKAIDVDLVYSGEKIIELLGQQLGNCSSDKDCEFFDCASLCDIKRQKCTSVRISNNLQVICRDLFKSKWYEGGLLASIPSQSEEKINKILDECAAQTKIPWTKQKFHRIFKTLKRYLLDEQNRL
ncbi:divergent protein kinase domain 1C-like isoform X2 [Dendronephthya gigantea]|nr:divergent protein kinase domain 1C-like isoform X2 [Dendronephthya gigantea]